MYYALKVQLKRDRASIAPPQNSVFCAHRNTWKYDDFDISTLSICAPPPKSLWLVQFLKILQWIVKYSLMLWKNASSSLQFFESSAIQHLIYKDYIQFICGSAE